MSSPTPRPTDKAVVADERSPPPSPTHVKPTDPLAHASSSQPDPAADLDASSSADDVIDLETFNQILDLDEDETHDFSSGMAWAYFAQARGTFKEMDEALAAEDLGKLSSLGHFLKGSSAALGVAKVQASCERMQHYGLLRDEEVGIGLSKDEALGKIGPLLEQVKNEYDDAEKWLKEWYSKHGVTGDNV
ncbi:hypothetical protein M0805_001564 [Coniferiporia weirii]|nr:hypothetical protein M0805_001564 [Coniferiporia weirii]